MEKNYLKTTDVSDCSPLSKEYSAGLQSKTSVFFMFLVSENFKYNIIMGSTYNQTWNKLFNDA